MSAPYTDIECGAARIIASLIYPDYPGGPDLDADAAVFGLYDSPIELLRDQHRDAVRLAPITGTIYDPHADAADSWEGMRNMSSAATPYARIDPLIREIGTEIAAQQTQTARAALHANVLPTSAPSRAQHTNLIHADNLGIIPKPVWLIDRTIATNKLTMTFALPGSGKSFLVCDMALCIAQHVPVIYVAAEAVEDYQDRIEAWKEYHKLPSGQLHFWPEPIAFAKPQSVMDFINAVLPCLLNN